MLAQCSPTSVSLKNVYVNTKILYLKFSAPEEKEINVRYGPLVLVMLHLNVEGLSANKICVINLLVTGHKALVILIQETHCRNAEQLVVPHFILAGWISSRKHGLATFFHEKLSWTFLDQSLERSAIEWLCVDIDGCKIVNVYKPPTSQLTLIIISVFPYPCLYAGDFNCQHIYWGYSYTNLDGECLDDWAAKENLSPSYNPKNAPSFFSGC